MADTRQPNSKSSPIEERLANVEKQLSHIANRMAVKEMIDRRYPAAHRFNNYQFYINHVASFTGKKLEDIDAADVYYASCAENE